MAITTQHKVTVDTWVSEADPNDNHAYGPELQVRSGATNDTKRALLSFGVPFPQGANVISAHLYVYLANVQSGSQTYTCRRLINPWKNARVTWNNIPTATATNDDTVSPGNSARLARRMKAAGDDVQLVRYPGGGHLGIIGAYSGSLRFVAPVVKDVDNFIARISAARASPNAGSASPASRPKSSTLWIGAGSSAASG